MSRELFTLDPFTALAEVDRFFAEADRVWRGLPNRSGALVNAYHDDSRLVVTTELPGVAPGDVDVQLVGDTLTITAKRQRSDLPQGARWLRRERADLSVRRAVQLPFRVDPDSAQAQVKDGLLIIVVNRAAEDRPRAITVKAA